MAKCDICGKKMPPHILEKHLAKSHSGVTSTEEPKIVGPKKEEKKWNWGEIRECGVCKQEWPDKLMGIHVRHEHGI